LNPGARPADVESMSLRTRLGLAAALPAVAVAGTLALPLGEDERAVLAACVVLVAVVAALLLARWFGARLAELTAAARRLANGDFGNGAPGGGGAELAELGAALHDASERLGRRVSAAERRRSALEAGVRRIGEALEREADRGVLASATVQAALSACRAEAARAHCTPLGGFGTQTAGAVDGPLEQAMQAAEARAGSQASAHASVAGAHAVAVAMRSVLGAAAGERLGVVSVARAGRWFSREEEELLGHLAGVAVAGIQNLDMHEAVAREAVRDGLTGLANERALRSALEREVERARRLGTPLALLSLEVDGSDGSPAGRPEDEVLRAVARVVRDLSREVDVAARLGGRRLAVAMPATGVRGAVRLAERMRLAVARLRLERNGGSPAGITASFGVAALPEDAEDGEALLAASGAALGRAARSGRNRVERAATGPPRDPGTAG
jgi:diguanylate cyclase (GGDEF)-like protein